MTPANPRSRRHGLALAGLLVAIGTGCVDPPTGPASLTVTVRPSAEQIVSGADFEVTVWVANNTNRPVELRWFGCLFEPRIRRDGSLVPWEGTSLGCILGSAQRTLAPAESIESTFELAAVDVGGVDPVPAEPGSYVLSFLTTAAIEVPSTGLVVLP